MFIYLACSDAGNSILVIRTYKYTYYTANNNPWAPSYNLASWKLKFCVIIPNSPNINLHLLYTNNNNLKLVTMITSQAGSQIRFKDVNGYSNMSQLQIVGSSSFTIDGNTTETLNTTNLSKLYVWLGGSSGGSLMSL